MPAWWRSWRNAMPKTCSIASCESILITTDVRIAHRRCCRNTKVLHNLVGIGDAQWREPGRTGTATDLGGRSMINEGVLDRTGRSLGALHVGRRAEGVMLPPGREGHTMTTLMQDHPAWHATDTGSARVMRCGGVPWLLTWDINTADLLTTPLCD